MQVDYVLKGDRVTINYRYFSNVGKAISVITMKGKIIDSLQNGHQFHLGLSQVDIATLDSEASQPQHMKYMANVSRMNLDNHDIHSETINILAERNGYAHILFEPSNVVCGCKVIS
ncbi:hypothetical protein [Paraferrimonas sedimenticola]|uniref:Uncharacterized protein n=1 Tax=Paraferrimonas sedimenticola TaxID=375674 RepID=A0AA37RY49_9GAMM|nr:hypothetical protein [Paraferrimonas sedimenticola]GLP97049.1 hypothetical protein GCM10007895_23550 [Paraferrimonas sedimenticola]